MAVRRDKRGKWRYRKVVKLLDGTKVRISGTPTRNTREAAEQDERAHIERVRNPQPKKERKEVPKFGEWFRGRFWREWVVGRKNKPGEADEKMRVFESRLEKRFGERRLDEIGVAEIAAFRASLVEEKLTEKTINNILAVLSKPLHYAADVEAIARAPKVGLLKFERPEFVCWEVEEYTRILAAAREEGPDWYAAVCLAGEAGLRVGEVRALRWREDVDMVAKTITVNQQSRHGVTGTPKGRTRRVLPMTATLALALRQLDAIRTGFVVRDLDGTPKTDGQTSKAIYRIYERAKVPERFGAWHVLRHSFGTHAALFGVNPWTLMRWMGHKRIDETMLYVNLASAHVRAVPQAIIAAGANVTDPDGRIIAMLGERGNVVATTEEGGEVQRTVSGS